MSRGRGHVSDGYVTYRTTTDRVSRPPAFNRGDGKGEELRGILQGIHSMEVSTPA